MEFYTVNGGLRGLGLKDKYSCLNGIIGTTKWCLANLKIIYLQSSDLELSFGGMPRKCGD